MFWNTGESEGYGVGLILGEDGSNIVVKRIIAELTRWSAK